MIDCAPCCADVSAKHHQVIIDLVHGVTGDREPGVPRGRRLTPQQAWERTYSARGEAARVNCRRMLRDATAQECLKHHRMLRARGSIMEREEFEAQVGVRSAAKIADITHFGEPDPAEILKALEITLRGVESRSSTKASESELLPEVGEPGDAGYCPAVTAHYPAGRRKASDRQISKAWMRATQSYYMDPMSEWPQDLRDALVGWQETKSGRLLAVFSQDRNASLLADVKGWKSMTLNERGARQVADELLQGARDRLLGLLQAQQAGAVGEWYRETCLSRAAEDERFSALAEKEPGAVELAAAVW